MIFKNVDEEFVLDVTDDMFVSPVGKKDHGIVYITNEQAAYGKETYGMFFKKMNFWDENGKIYDWKLKA